MEVSRGGPCLTPGSLAGQEPPGEETPWCLCGLSLHAPSPSSDGHWEESVAPTPIQVHLPKLKFVQKAGGEGALGRAAEGDSPEEYPKPSASQAITQRQLLRPVQHWALRDTHPWGSRGGRWVSDPSQGGSAGAALPGAVREGSQEAVSIQEPIDKRETQGSAPTRKGTSIRKTGLRSQSQRL